VDWYAWRDTTLVLKLRVQPRARQPGIDGLYGDRLRVRLQGPPVDDKANDELLGLLATAFGLSRHAAAITQGEHGQQKTVALSAPRALPAWFVELGGLPCPGSGASSGSLPRGRH